MGLDRTARCNSGGTSTSSGNERRNGVRRNDLIGDVMWREVIGELACHGMLGEVDWNAVIDDVS